MPASVVNDILVLSALADRHGFCLSLQFDEPSCVVNSNIFANCSKLSRVTPGSLSPFRVVLSSEQPAISYDLISALVYVKIHICMRHV